MKKIILIFLILLLGTTVYADEITDNIILEAKWYKENMNIIYYPKKDKLDGYLEESNIITYGEISNYSESNCNLDSNNYLIQKFKRYQYKRIGNIKYIKLKNISINDIKNIEIYEDLKKKSYTIKEENNNILIILDKDVNTSLLWLYIDTDSEYLIEASSNPSFYSTNLSKEVKGNKVLIPDKTWIPSKPEYLETYTIKEEKANDLNVLVREYYVCAYNEIKTLRYKKSIEYYDNDYHEYIDGYLPDLNTINIKFNGIIPEKIIKDYVYIPTETEKIVEIEPQCEEPKIKYIENNVFKKIYKTPKHNYYIIGILFVITIIELAVIIKKNVD